MKPLCQRILGEASQGGSWNYIREPRFHNDDGNGAHNMPKVCFYAGKGKAQILNHPKRPLKNCFNLLQNTCKRILHAETLLFQSDLLESKIFERL